MTSQPSLENSGPMLEMRGVCKNYGPVQALCDLDFKIFNNEIVGLLGDNGAGKSTLIKMISGVVRVDKGEIFWNGKAIHMNFAP